MLFYHHHVSVSTQSLRWLKPACRSWNEGKLKGNFSKGFWKSPLPTCRCVESLPASRTSPRTGAPAGGDQNKHSVQLAAPAPPCTQDCCIYWSPRTMTSFPESRRGNFRTVAGSMFSPHVWQIKEVLTWTHPSDIYKFLFLSFFFFLGKDERLLKKKSSVSNRQNIKPIHPSYLPYENMCTLLRYNLWNLCNKKSLEIKYGSQVDDYVSYCLKHSRVNQ